MAVKRVLLLILSLVMLCCSASAEDADEAEALRSFLESHYGLSVRMGEECRAYSTDDFQIVIRPDGDTPFQRLMSGKERFLPLLRLLDDVLSAYPPDFVSAFRWTPGYGGLMFLLVDDISRDGVSYGGLQSGVTEDGEIILWLSRQSAGERAIHHEIGHAVDYRIRWQFPDAFDTWYKLNPEDFLYSGDFTYAPSDAAEDEPADWFVRAYGMIDEYEDRATIFEALMLKDESWWESRPHLQKKAGFFLVKAEPIFGDLFPGE